MTPTSTFFAYFIAIVVILWLIYYLSKPTYEQFGNDAFWADRYCNGDSSAPYINPQYCLTSTDLPFWNSQIGTRRNMSYDLRGDPLIIPKTWVPFNMSSTTPIYNRGI
jgi:hypothetical protein